MLPEHHDRLSCSQIAARIQLHVDGEEDEDSAVIREHVRQCADCADAVELYGAIKAVLAHSLDDTQEAIDRLAEFTRQLAASGQDSAHQSAD